MAVARFELAFEVDRPDRVGLGDRRGGLAGMGAAPRPPAFGHTAVALEDAVNSRNGWDARIGPIRPEEFLELGRAPAPAMPQGEDRLDDLGRRGMRTAMRLMRAVAQGVRAGVGVAREPLVAGLAADAVATAEFGEGAGRVLGVEDKTLAFVHG